MSAEITYKIALRSAKTLSREELIAALLPMQLNGRVGKSNMAYKNLFALGLIEESGRKVRGVPLVEVMMAAWRDSYAKEGEA